MADARAKTKTTKRRKVWVNWYGAEPKLHVTRLSAQKLLVKSQGGVTVPFVESRPGDVVLSREDVEKVRSLLGKSSEAAGLDMAGEVQMLNVQVLRLLRGGR